ncbi:MAG: VOC family protein [Methanotrichaceae archaeon]|jgi:predicted enzyme related to lactoylglutathione lyase
MSIVHFEIPVDDLNRAKKFYSQLFGWKLQDMQAWTTR